MITFSVPGLPVAKGRPKASVIGGKARLYTPGRTVAYEGLVAHAGAEAMRGRSPLDGPLSLNVIATFPIPKSWPKTRQAAALHHTGRPDADNILKAIGDGLNQVVWADDSQLARVSVEKRYGAVPGVIITVQALECANG